eukprot:gene589-735_t
MGDFTTTTSSNNHNHNSICKQSSISYSSPSPSFSQQQQQQQQFKMENNNIEEDDDLLVNSGSSSPILNRNKNRDGEFFKVHHFKKNMCDGGGFVLNRLIGSKDLEMVDPILLFDEIKTNRPEEYKPGNTNVILTPGTLQLMVSGKGIQHSEMPFVETEGQLLWVFHFWVNLLKKDKLCDPIFQRVGPELIPIWNNSDEMARGKVQVKVLAGNYKGIQSPLKIIGPTLVLDVSIDSSEDLDRTLSSFLFETDSNKEGRLVVFNHVSSFRDIRISPTINSSCRFIFCSGKKIDEPIARFGPFVMTSQQEIHQCFIDFDI